MIRLEAVDVPTTLSGLTFDVPDGGFRWITGPAGAGKSALVSLLARARPPQHGRIRLFETDLARARPAARARLRRRIGLIDQDRPLVGHLSVLENTALPLLIDGASASAAHIDALDMLDWVGLGALAGREARTLSRGQRLLATVARAVVGRPALLLADEPTEGLGEADGSRLVQLLLEMNRLGATVLVATRSEALRRCHKAPTLALESGRLVREPAA